MNHYADKSGVRGSIRLWGMTNESEDPTLSPIILLIIGSDFHKPPVVSTSPFSPLTPHQPRGVRVVTHGWVY